MLMEMNMTVDGKMENEMVWDYTNIQMEINMREILLAIKNMVEVPWEWLVEMFMMVNGMKEERMVKVFIDLQMVMYMMDISKTA